MSGSNLKASYIIRTEQLFNQKGWEIDHNKALKLSVYKKYIDRLKRIPPDTQDLFLELTFRFDRIELKDIAKLFFEAYRNIDEEVLKSARKIYILPLVIPTIEKKSSKFKIVNWFRNFFPFIVSKQTQDRPRSKSGEKVLSIVESSEYRELSNSSKFIFPQLFSRFLKIFNKKKDILILVDDFVGTGDTANSVLSYFFKKNKFDKDNTIILTMASMKEGVKNILEDYNVKVYSAIYRDKAISKYYESKSEIEINKQRVISMEKHLKCEEDLSLGYKQSEALISIMNKSPNNTLPVFWFETKNIPAPFPRKKIYNK